MDEGEAVHDYCQPRSGEAQAGDGLARVRRQLPGRPPPPAMRNSTLENLMSTHFLDEAVGARWKLASQPLRQSTAPLLRLAGPRSPDMQHVQGFTH